MYVFTFLRGELCGVKARGPPTGSLCRPAPLTSMNRPGLTLEILKSVCPGPAQTRMGLGGPLDTQPNCHPESLTNTTKTNLLAYLSSFLSPA